MSEEEATRREGPAGLHLDAPGLDRGSFVGRYVLLDVVGQGGMGVVYSAYDPELDRKVAIKLLQARSGESTGGQAWLVREAQAMAKLSHPNVIAVHDVGVLSDDRMFVAMELVDGETLRAWLKVRRSWREVIPVLRAAGTGLAAAHAVGLVHRDFKPDNVLVGGDGRVRVMDFGLARLGEPTTPASRTSDMQIEARSPLQDTLTEAGTVMGTPAYMAPEIHDGQGATPRSDQFAFGVALYEALYDDRPFDKHQLVPPRETPPKPKPPPDVGVPARIQRAVMRAIAIDPDARFATMTELLDELAYDPNARRRRIAVAAAAVVLLGAVGASAFAIMRGDEPACLAPSTRFAGVWDAHTKQVVHAGFVASKKPYAERAYVALEHALDGYVAGWSDAAVGNCTATRVRHEQSERVRVVRQSCLEQRFEELRVLAKQLETPSDALVERADQVVFDATGRGLPPVSECANVLALLPAEPVAIDPARYALVRNKLATARGQAIAGQYIPALTALQSALADAKLIHAEGLEADALLVRGGVLMIGGNVEDATAALEEATWSAMRGHRDDIVAQAALSTALAVADRRTNNDLADVWLRLAIAASSRYGGDKLFEMRRYEAEGVIQGERGQLQAAIATHRKAVASAEAAYGPDSPALWSPEEVLAASMARAGAWTEALPHFERSRKLREAAVGPDHPDVALIDSNLGACYDHAGNPQLALAAYERALAVRERTYGANSPYLVATLNNLADFKLHTGDARGASVYVERAYLLAEKIGRMSTNYHVVATTRAEVLGALGKVAESRAAFDALLELEDKLQSPERGTTLSARGQLELHERAWPAAASFEERAIAAYDAVDKDSLAVWKPLAGLATARRALDPKADVKPLLERAVAVAKKAQVLPADLQPIEAALAAP